MSIARRAFNPLFVRSAQRRFSSHDSNEHHANEHDSTQFVKEAGFNTPFWRNSLLFSLAVVAFYKYAPAPGEEAYITRYLATYATPRDTWASLNERHSLLSQQASEIALLQMDAKRPLVQRFRYPQFLDEGSHHLQAVGLSVDMSSVVVKDDRD